MKINLYDIIIIGSGIAGLYSAYKIKKNSPKTKFLILEKYKKKWIGGRMNNEKFYGATVVTGAGVGRNDTNPLLIKLLKQLHVPYKKGISIMNYSKLLPKHSEFDVVKIIDFLKKEYEKNPNYYRKFKFRDFGAMILGDLNYKLFTIYSGYTDYEDADVYDTLYNYGMDDNKGGWPILYINWKQLVYKLYEIIGYNNIKFSNNVISVKKINNLREPCLFEIITENNNTFFCNKVIIATTITGILKLVPGASEKSSIYQQIHGQPFLRLYAKFDKKSSNILKNFVENYTIVPGPLQKIIPMDKEKGVYMIAYSDNNNAVLLKEHLKNTFQNKKLYEKLIEKSLGIPEKTLHIIEIKDYYWPIGTHYYEPLHGNYKNREEFINKAQHPIEGMLVVGEAVSNYQGWSEGALESVENVLTNNWIQKLC